MTWSSLAFGFSRGTSECACSSQFPSGNRSSLALRILSCVTECARDLFRVGQAAPLSLLGWKDL